jgi:hypothetical protein
VVDVWVVACGGLLDVDVLVAVAGKTSVFVVVDGETSVLVALGTTVLEPVAICVVLPDEGAGAGAEAAVPATTAPDDGLVVLCPAEPLLFEPLLVTAAEGACVVGTAEASVVLVVLLTGTIGVANVMIEPFSTGAVVVAFVLPDGVVVGLEVVGAVVEEWATAALEPVDVGG